MTLKAMNTLDLKSMDNAQLENSFIQAVKTERKIMHIVLQHVQEVHRRQLYLAKGDKSLHDYLVKFAKYSGSCASSRISAANLVTILPEISDKLQSGELNFTQLGEINNAVKKAENIHQMKVSTETKAQLVQSVLGQTSADTQQTCAAALNIPVVKHQKVKTQKDGSKRVEYTMSKAQAEKYEIVKGLLAHKNFQKKRTQDMNDVLETMMDEILSMDTVKNTVSKNRKTKAEITAEVNHSVNESDQPGLSISVKSQEGQNQKCSSTSETMKCATAVQSSEIKKLATAPQFTDMKQSKKIADRTAHATQAGTGAVVNGDTKKIAEAPEKWNSLTPKRKKIVFQEEGRDCKYEDYETGKVCGSTFNPHIDHMTPKHAGGKNDAGNLRVLCRAHNLFRNRTQSQDHTTFV